MAENIEKITSGDVIFRRINPQFKEILLFSEMRNGPAPDPKSIRSSLKFEYPLLG
jgi:hypothetical protein